MNKQDIKRVAKDLKEAVEWLKQNDSGCVKISLPNVYSDLVLAVGWSAGYAEDDNSVIHSKSEPSWAINAGIKVQAGYMATDYDSDFNFLYNEKSGDTHDSSLSISPNYSDKDYEQDAEWLLAEAEALDKYQFDEDGKIEGHRKFFELSEQIAYGLDQDECNEIRKAIEEAKTAKEIDEAEVEKLLADLKEQESSLEETEEEEDE